MKRIKLTIVLLLAFTFMKCDSSKSDLKNLAYDYFYGTELDEGIMLSNYDDQMKGLYLGVIKDQYSLKNSLHYHDENIFIHEISKSEFLIDHDLILASKDNEAVLIQTKYYFSSHINEPVPLIRLVYSTEDDDLIAKETLWFGDFDSFLEKNLKKTIKPMYPHPE